MVVMPADPHRRRRLTRQQRRRRARLRGLAALCVIIAVVVLAAVGIARVAGGSPKDPQSTGASQGGNAGGSAPASSGGATPAAASSAGPVRVVSGGDVMTDRAVKSYAAQYGTSAVLAGIAPQLEAGDAAFVNLEGSLATIGSPAGGKDYTFEGPPAMAKALAGAGIDVVTMANNHAVDYGRAAFMAGIKTLEKAGVQVAGGGKDFAAAHSAAVVTTKDGVTIGFLGYDDVIWPGFAATATEAGIAEAVTDMSQVKKDVRDLAKRVDYVVVGFHWGIEYTHYPIAQQTSEAHAVIDAGADLVIGSHPHVLQGFETYRGALISYSLGDLVFDHFSVQTGQTVLVDAVVTPTGVKATLVPVYVSSSGIPAVQHGTSAQTILSLVKEYSKPLGTYVHITGDTATVKAGKP
jgi:poly-gamma-glutamate capsule biosynthesis protein CapA/YwtB (metallophosphatase superfamily)